MKNLLTLFLLSILCSCCSFIKCCYHDISYKVFTRTNPRCSDYQGKYCSNIQDYTTGTPAPLQGELVITYNVGTGNCTLSTNGIPNHDVNDGSAKFKNTPAPVERVFTITNSPTANPAGPAALSIHRYNAILLNGAVVDLVSDGCCVGSTDGAPAKDILVGCGDSVTWRLNPMSPAAGFTKDKHNAHCQNDGTYHYHGPPIGLYEYPSTKVSPVIGFAADGFPIHGPYFEDSNGVIREAKSSWRCCKPRSPGVDGCPIGAKSDGKYIQDYFYEPGYGDLDECNGMVVKGQYYYFVTNDYPYIMGCFTGTPDATFDHKP
jgi:hypothetical protein